MKRINLERGSSSGQDRYINQATNKQTTDSENPEIGGRRKSPSKRKIAIKAGTINFGKACIRSKSGVLMSVIFLRIAEWVTTGTVGFGFLGFLLLLI